MKARFDFWCIIILILVIEPAWGQTCDCYYDKARNLWISNVDSLPCNGSEFRGIKNVTMCYFAEYIHGFIIKSGYLYPTGELRQEWRYRNNSIVDSTYAVLLPNGDTSAFAYYENGKLYNYVEHDSALNVNVRTYFLNDTAVYYEKYNNLDQRIELGLLHSNLQNSMLYNNTCQKYYGTGELKEIVNYSSGNLHGVSVQYSPSGCLSSIMRYENNKLEGWKYYFDETGSLIKKESYRNGELQEVIVKYNGQWIRSSSSK